MLARTCLEAFVLTVHWPTTRETSLQPEPLPRIHA
jgi:hypothetical protein